ncbi:hypothetical protein BHE74_00017451 [Ensete ventricosum]|nr:hypothetical protein GW17_00025050 [Ensete ventricosum]RWW74611.1 hypothetical protein BHE74_00017451 [Ensete ventricosum]
MAASMEIFGSSLLRRSPLLPSSGSPLFGGGEQRKLFFRCKPRRSCTAGRAVRTPVAAAVLTERFVRVEAEEKPVRFKVRAAVTVRRKKKEDLKETIANQLDAFSDKIGRNVVLELVSNEFDPSRLTLPLSPVSAGLDDSFLFIL